MATDLLSADATTADSVATRSLRTGTIAGGEDGSRKNSTGETIPSVRRGRRFRTSGAGQGSAENLDTPQTKTPTVFGDYVELTKPRIVTMILVTTTATAIMGAGGLVAWIDWMWLMIGTAAIAGSAGAANQIWERVIDCNMTRTANRPLPAGRVGLLPSLIYTATLGVVGTTVLWSFFGVQPALAGLATWMIYVLVYTPMKTRTAWNTTIGAIAGALPVLIGYTATGGQLSDATGWLLFGVLGTWQYPHFMAIAWMYRRQYDEAGFKMTTTVEPTGRSAGWQSIVGSLALIVCGVALCFINGFTWFAVPAAIGVLVATVPMLRASLLFAGQPDDITARKLLRSSLLVLPAVLLIVTLRVFW
ncbi:Protoheme IX farnesyltransferase [Rubripirellula lacrimiformis]|uniref:Protoheme IX farnesyltransferase n=1 Tax=Rubripirellula lacrimiformis TaxID=1930273 RepID=A0A517N5T2_9BACT|nr:protoheme IX farnesyltransferase [Rubripirellula lacrimiformis]QDT02492.1 Protoheme IX farnesyltransferase [Rubripirellula lacrimiformis]